MLRFASFSYDGAQFRICCISCRNVIGNHMTKATVLRWRQQSQIILEWNLQMIELWLAVGPLSLEGVFLQNFRCVLLIKLLLQLVIYIWLGYCFTPYQRLWLYNGAPLVAFYDTLGIRRTYSRLKTPGVLTGAFAVSDKVGIPLTGKQLLLVDCPYSNWPSKFGGVFLLSLYFFICSFSLASEETNWTKLFEKGLLDLKVDTFTYQKTFFLPCKVC